MTVFSAFHCGGGSTMGYKLAGFDVLGGVEIDPKMMEVYQANHHPKHPFLMGVGDFNKIPDAELPPELFELDILDGSPPCSSFSTAGTRHKDWGKFKKFREGQAHQVLDDLFFDFVRMAKKLQPKVVIAENVMGLLGGRAKGYVKEILEGMTEAGYDTQIFVLDASTMGVPQRRRRVFFISRRRDLELPKLALEFNEPGLPFFKAALEAAKNGCDAKRIPPSALKRWEVCKNERNFEMHIGGFFSWTRVDPFVPVRTILAQSRLCHPNEPRLLSDQEVSFCQTFPIDYDYRGQLVPYICGMSVPPFMMHRLSLEVARQIFGVS